MRRVAGEQLVDEVLTRPERAIAAAFLAAAVLVVLGRALS